MDCRLLTGDHLDLSDYRLGTPQQAGCLTVVPITTQQPTNGILPPPASGAITDPARAGAAILHNISAQDCLLAPLHFELPVERSRSHILSCATLIPPTERLALTQERAFPYASTRSKRIGVARNYCLPLSLRASAWSARHAYGVQRLGANMGDLQRHLWRNGLGKLPSALQAGSPELNRYRHRIELLAGQTGALFFIEDRPVGLEIAPSPAYFAAAWQPLLLGCYGLTALLCETDSPYTAPPLEPYAISRLADLRTELFRVRHQRQEQWEAAVAFRSKDAITIEEEQGWQNYRVQSLTSRTFAGQYVEEVTAIEAENGGAMPRMLRNLFRKGSMPNEANIRRRVIYVSLFAVESNPR